MPFVLEKRILFNLNDVLDEKSEATFDESDSDSDFTYYTESSQSDDDDDDDDDSYGSSSSSDDDFGWFAKSTPMPKVSSEPTFVNTEMTATQVSVLINQLRTTSINKTTDKSSLLRRMASRKGGNHILSINGESMEMAHRNSSMCDLRDAGNLNAQNSSSKSETTSSSSMKTGDSSSENPFEYLKDILAEANIEFRTFKCEQVEDFFQKITKERTDAYSVDMIRAVRMSDVDTLRSMLVSDNKNCRFDGCNRFGESILHTACRRGSSDVLRFLLEEAKVDVRVRDDYGRTPMHDACWTAQPNVGMIGLLVKVCPDLLVVEDKRGMTPLEYVRAGQWGAWMKFMKRNRNDLIPKVLLRPSA
eukprot:CAMPEP_0116853244 /NCGR_PEP_ID=MMETSP0418-20121206/17796_1 /TAXON_ID=1158023 /ORGANISM="Astrosyne radiata, Strain 13vi08-1A" /LENGTH=359 /DNA_ID=CAMNT_0004485607 /DNA_START=445 /DNA_END=1524 /DNA_ORIENTATION=+